MIRNAYRTEEKAGDLVSGNTSSGAVSRNVSAQFLRPPAFVFPRLTVPGKIQSSSLWVRCLPARAKSRVQLWGAHLCVLGTTSRKGEVSEDSESYHFISTLFINKFWFSLVQDQVSRNESTGEVEKSQLQKTKSIRRLYF